jgi:hypothetical protein
MNRFFFILFLVVLPKLCSSQDDKNSAVTLNFQYHPYDFFLGIGYQYAPQKWEHEARIGFGINRSIFQTRLYPKLTYQFGRRFIIYRTFTCTPFIRLDGSLLDVSSDKNRMVLKWFDPSLGLKLSNGKQLKYGVSAGIGPSWEWNTLKAGSIQTWNVYAEINFSYAL